MIERLIFKVRDQEDDKQDERIVGTNFPFDERDKITFHGFVGPDETFAESVMGLDGVCLVRRSDRYGFWIMKGRVFAWEDILPGVERLLRGHAGEAS